MTRINLSPMIGIKRFEVHLKAGLHVSHPVLMQSVVKSLWIAFVQSTNSD